MQNRYVHKAHEIFYDQTTIHCEFKLFVKVKLVFLCTKSLEVLGNYIAYK